jgi:hypothetical protein
VNGSQLKFFNRALALVPNRNQPVSLLTRTRPHNYWISIGLRNQVRDQKTKRKHNSVQAKVTSETMTTKISPTCFTLLHEHFIEHLTIVTEKPPQKYNKNLGKHLAMFQSKKSLIYTPHHILMI